MCMLSVPEAGCGELPCSSLVTAVGSFIDALLEWLFGPHWELDASEEEQDEAISEYDWWD